MIRLYSIYIFLFLLNKFVEYLLFYVILLIRRLIKYENTARHLAGEILHKNNN